METHRAPRRRWPCWHRWLGAVVAAPLLFYGITGILLNHRKTFGYFQRLDRTVRPVAKLDPAPLRDFIGFYKTQIGRSDDPAVIRIRNGRTVEFLYGSHGQTTYVIDPVAGTLTTVVKHPVEPWATLNRLHKAFGTPATWAWASDGLTLGLLGAGLTGFLVPLAWRRTKRAVILAGLGFVGLCVWAVQFPGH